MDSSKVGASWRMTQAESNNGDLQISCSTGLLVLGLVEQRFVEVALASFHNIVVVLLPICYSNDSSFMIGGRILTDSNVLATLIMFSLKGTLHIFIWPFMISLNRTPMSRRWYASLVTMFWMGRSSVTHVS